MTNDERNRLDVIEAKLDLVLYRLDTIDKGFLDHEVRIRSTEKWKLGIPVSALLAVATLLGSFLTRNVQ